MSDTDRTLNPRGAFVLLPIGEFEELRRRAQAAEPLYEIKEGTFDELVTGVPCGYLKRSDKPHREWQPPRA
jgi:hypothetical protein